MYIKTEIRTKSGVHQEYRMPSIKVKTQTVLRTAQIAGNDLSVLGINSTYTLKFGLPGRDF